MSTLVAAAAGPSDGELMIETDGDNLGASHVVSDERAGNAIKVPSLRLQRILGDGRRRPCRCAEDRCRGF